MFEMFCLNMKHICPVLVVSTVSSGKSTLINAMIGRELLPSGNRACTAKAAAVLNNDSIEQFGIHTVDKEGKYCFLEQATEKVVADYNQSHNVEEMIIEGNIRGVRNGKKALMLVDTPGLNYSMDQTHEAVTKAVLGEYRKGIILYVINVQQMATYDDKNSLNLVVRKIKDNPKFKVIFVINKMDQIDVDREKPDELVENCRKYVQKQGVDKPVLIPVSAKSALVFRKVLNKEFLSQTEKDYFERNYKRFRRHGYSLVDYVSMPEYKNSREIFIVGNGKYTGAEICAALEHTGLPFLEKTIVEILTGSKKAKTPEIQVKNCRKE